MRGCYMGRCGGEQSICPGGAWIEENGAKLGLQNELINAVLLAQEYQQDSAAIADKKAVSRHSPWIPHVLREIERTTGNVNLGAAVPWRTGRNSCLWALGIIALVVLAVVLFPNTFAHGMQVLMAPGKFVPIQGAVRILDVAPKDDTVLAGQSESFSVEVDSPGNRPIVTRLEVAYASGKTARYDMTASGAGNSKYTYTLASLAEDLNYTIMAGDSQSERYHITVRPDIHLVSYKMLVKPPAYTGKPEETVVLAGKDLTAAKGSLEVPLGSSVELTAVLDMDVRDVVLDMADHTPQVMDHLADKTFSKMLIIKEAVRLQPAGQ